MAIAEALNRDLFARYLALAFPGRPTAVRFALSNTRKPTASEVADLAVKLKGAGYSVVKADLEEKVGLPLVKDEPAPTPFGGHFSANKQPVSTHSNSGDGKTPVKTDGTPVKIAPQGSGGQGDGSGAEGLKRLVEGFGDDLAPAAKEVADLLAAIEAGEDAKGRAEKLLERLPSLLPDDPAAAAVLAEEMAKAVGEVAKDNGVDPLGNVVDANGNEHADSGENGGQFVKKGEGSGGTSKSASAAAKAKKKSAKRERQADNKARGVAGMRIVERGGDCLNFMRSKKLGNIAFYQGNDREGYLHIKNNPDPNHQVMLKDGNIPNTLAYGKYYKDTYQNFSGWSVIHGDKCVFLGKDGDGVKIITAYVSKSKAAVFSRRAAIENKEV